MSKEHQELNKQYVNALGIIHDLSNKLRLLGMQLKTEDGIFTFPDGDCVVTRKKNNG